MKLFPKLALSIASLLLITTAGLSLSYYLIEQRSIHRLADEQRQAILRNLVHITQEAFLADDDLLLVKYTGWLQKGNPSLVSASVVDTQGRILSHSQPERIGDASFPETSRTEALLLSEPVKVGNRWIATASAAFSVRYFEEQLRERLHQLKRRVLWIAVPALTAGLLIAFFTALSWSRTVGRLARAAERIGDGRYDFDLGGTDRRKDELGVLSRAFRSMAQRLRELDELKEDFVSAVTHELRSPLGAIESYLNLIQDEIGQGIAPVAWPEYLERMRMNTQRLTRFVNDLLDVAALERGKMDLRLQPVAVDRLAQEVLDLFAPKLQEKRLRAALEAPRPLPLAMADADKIRQVLTNLLSNAIKFTPAGGWIKIRVHTNKGSRRLGVAVRDTGPGISAEDQKKIFNKFEQVRSTRQTVKGPKGTGLGLSISRALIEQHGGRLDVESRPGEGATFVFDIPIVRDSEIPKESTPEEMHEAGIQ